MTVKILLILGVLMYYFGKLLDWMEEKQHKTYKFRNKNNVLDFKKVQKCSEEHRALVKIFHGSYSVKHQRAWEILAEEDLNKRELALIRILKDVWREFPYMLERLEEREHKLMAKSASVVKADTMGDFGGTIEWHVKY